MANIAKILKTDVMADMNMPALAQMLQSMGRRGDKILAHITPKEAKKLKREGGAGTINPDTGLPEFYDGEEMPLGAEEFSGEAPVEAPSGVYPQDTFMPMEAPSGVYPGAYTPQVPEITAEPSAAGVSPAARLPVAGAGVAPGITDDLRQTWEKMSPDKRAELLLRGGLGVGTGIMGALQSRAAAKQARGIQQQIAGIGAPYQQQGQEMIAKAQRGELTPVNEQQLQAARAALAQGVERRGGVGAQQAEVQLQAFRQQLLQNQYDYGLKVAQIGDTYASQAVRVGMTQDQEILRLMQGLTGAIGGFMGNQPQARA